MGRSGEPPKKKSKKEKETVEEAVVATATSVAFQAAIASPYAPLDHKFTKKVFKLVHQATKSRCVVRGIKPVTKAMRKGTKGLLVMGANVTPVDCISYLPGYCEDLNVPYIWVPSRELLGNAANSKRPMAAVLVTGTTLSDKHKKKMESAMKMCKKMQAEVRALCDEAAE
jgi:H/ACA ribonucleoprotein complex subunit 2